MPEPSPLVRVGGYNEGGIQFVVHAWVATADYWDMFFDLNERVGRLFRESGVRMPERRYEIDLKEPRHDERTV